MSRVSLAIYGMTDSLAAEAALHPQLYPARIVSQEKGLYQAVGEGGQLTAVVSGKLQYAAATALDFPAVGDFVLLDRSTGNSGNAVIHHILSRKSVFLRKTAGKTGSGQVVAANIDTVFLCMALNSDFNLHRLERYISLAWESGATPVVVLTKADLCCDLSGKLNAVTSVAIGVETLVTTSMEQDGWQEILDYIKPGNTIALLGSSGVGKSTLLNRLLGEERLETKDIRNDGKGRHTTTRRQLVLLPQGGLVIDTPGMRELGIYDADDGLEKSFADVEAFFHQCRFRNCTHTREPGCGVWAAIEAGELSAKRWNSYRQLKAENAYSQDSKSYLQAKEQRLKAISKTVKEIKKKKR